MDALVSSEFSSQIDVREANSNTDPMFRISGSSMRNLASQQ